MKNYETSHIRSVRLGPALLRQIDGIVALGGLQTRTAVIRACLWAYRRKGPLLDPIPEGGEELQFRDPERLAEGLPGSMIRAVIRWHCGSCGAKPPAPLAIDPKDAETPHRVVEEE